MHKKNKFNIVNFDEDYAEDSSDEEPKNDKKVKNENK